VEITLKCIILTTLQTEAHEFLRLSLVLKTHRTVSRWTPGRRETGEVVHYPDIVSLKCTTDKNFRINNLQGGWEKRGHVVLRLV